MTVSRRRALLVAVALTAVTTTGAGATAGAAPGQFGATVTDADAAGSATLLFGHAYGASTCTSVPAGGVIDNATVAAIACAGSVLPAVDTGAAATTTDAVTNQGSSPAAAVTARVGLVSCAPRALSDPLATADPMLPRYATTLNAGTGTAGTGATNAHPLTGGGSISLNGTTDYASDVTQTTFPAFSVGASMSYGIWFKTTSTTGGGLFSFDTSPTTAAGGTSYLALAMTPAGTLSVVNPVGATTAATTAAYNNGAWHYAYLVLAVSKVLGVTLGTVTLYVDGSTTAVIGPTTGLNVSTQPTGYWHAGWSRGAGYLAGSLSSFAVLGAALSSGASLYGAGTQSAYDALVKANAGVEEWPMADAPTATFTGTVPVIGTTPPCSMVNLSWAGSPGESTSAAVTTPVAVAVAAPGATLTQSVTLSTNATYNAAYVPGLQIDAPVAFSVSAGAGAWSTTFTWSGSGYVA